MERSFWTNLQHSGVIRVRTITQAYTYTILKLFEYFEADLRMLALRTQAMELEHAHECAHDVRQMALEQCLRYVHVQLYDFYGNLVRVHRYSLEKGILSNSQRPGGNRWPCLPNGTLRVVVTYSNKQRSEELKRSGKLKLDWTPSSLSTNYSGMRSDGARLYSSNGYGLRRDTFVN